MSARRFGLRSANTNHTGLLRLNTRGRRTAKERWSILGYIEDGPKLVLVPMNGWADPEPAWWLNLQSHPHASVELAGRRARDVTARMATEDERARLWGRLAGPFGNLDRYAALRSRRTAVVILEPRAAPE